MENNLKDQHYKNMGIMLQMETLTFEAEGVVEMTLQACHTYNIEAKSIEKRVKEKGLPYIHIETDYSQADVGQLDTRIAAFLEMI